MNTQRGFIRIMVILIVLVVLLYIADLGPINLWNQFILPVLKDVWEILKSIISFLTEVGFWIIEKLGPQK